MNGAKSAKQRKEQMRKPFALFVLLFVVLLVPASAQQSDNGLEGNLQFIEWMGMVFPPHSSLTDYPGFKDGVQFDPTVLGLQEVTAEKSWSVLNQDRETGKVFGDIIRKGQKYWAHPGDPRQVPVYKSDCLNRVFAFVGEPTENQILAAIAKLQQTLDGHMAQTGRIQEGVDELRDRIPLDPCTWFKQCAAEEGWSWRWLLLPLLLGALIGALVWWWRRRGREEEEEEEEEEGEEPEPPEEEEAPPVSPAPEPSPEPPPPAPEPEPAPEPTPEEPKAPEKKPVVEPKPEEPNGEGSDKE